ncbi:MAG: carboxypeptidase regulatory-like domain-containing protein [Gemmatimonadota bacterium]|nr:MAG: carboxypeptidase regulatory-like domain-containing protein [Gemmatimonadota bacterium]
MRELRTKGFAVLMSGALIAGATPGMSAQVLRGQVIDSTTGVQVGTGFIVLIDHAGEEVTRALSSPDGWFTLRAPRGGHYRLRSERIGYRTFVSRPFELRSDTTLTLRVVALPVRLAAVEVLGKEHCRTNPQGAAATAIVWEEIRKALAATAWSDTENRLRYRMYRYERDLSADRRRILTETGRSSEGPATHPYKSLDAAALADEGYIVSRRDGIWYYLPDAYTLMDDAFLGTHCFHTVRDAATRPGLVGLAFEPIPRRDVADVAGVLWLDEATSQLRTLEVGYTRIPGGIVDDRVGGTVEFIKLPSGVWIVHRWQIRAPAVTVQRTTGDPRSTRATVTGFTDIGGEVMQASTLTGAIVHRATLANVSGSIFDSTTSGPLSGARVSIDGTDFGTVSDSSGWFRFGVPLEGEYEVTFSHVKLDSIGFRPVPESVQLTRGLDRTLSLAVPPVDAILPRICPSDAGAGDRRALVGVVRGEGSVSRARVTASWQMAVTSNQRLYVRDYDEVAHADGSGFFVLCGLPAGRPLTVTAERRGAVSRSADVMFPGQLGGTLLMAWDRRLGDLYTESYKAPYPVWKVDLVLTPQTEFHAEMSRPSFSGVVTDRVTGQPVAAVAVRLNGSEAAVTGEDGTFQIAELEWRSGANEVAFDRIRYEPLVQQIWLEEGQDDIALGVALRPVTDEMREIVVDGAQVLVPAKFVGFYERRQEEVGWFLTPDEIAEIHAAEVYDLLRRIPGLSVVEVGVDRSIRVSNPSAMCRTQQGSPLVFVDGAVFPAVSLRSLPVQNVAAVEVYDAVGRIPSQFSVTGSGCGVIVIWTK